VDAGEVNGVKTDEDGPTELLLSLDCRPDDTSPFDAKPLPWCTSGENDGGANGRRLGEVLSKGGEQGDSLNVNGELADGCDLRESIVDQGAVDCNERHDSTMESLPSRSTWFDIEEVREVGG
jgi:hypothetical protein